MPAIFSLLRDRGTYLYSRHKVQGSYRCDRKVLQCECVPHKEVSFSSENKRNCWEQNKEVVELRRYIKYNGCRQFASVFKAF